MSTSVNNTTSLPRTENIVSDRFFKIDKSQMAYHPSVPAILHDGADNFLMSKLFNSDGTKEFENLQKEITRVENSVISTMKRKVSKLRIQVAALLLGEPNDNEFVKDLVTMTKNEFIQTRLSTRTAAFTISTKYCLISSLDFAEDESTKNYIYEKLKEKIKLPDLNEIQLSNGITSDEDIEQQDSEQNYQQQQG